MALKLAHITSTFPPYWAGTGNVAFHNARILHERGHDVTLFTARYRDDDDMSMPFEVRRLPAQFRVGNAPLTLDLVKQLRGFDVIHLHYPYIFGSELAHYAAWRNKTPLVLTYHNQLQEQTPLKKALFGGYNLLAEPLILNLAKRRLAVSREHLISLQARFAADPHTLELPNGVDSVQFSPQPGRIRQQFGTPDAAPVALFVGALDQAHRFKNVDGLIRAFAKAKQDAHDTLSTAELWIVGDGNLRPDLELLTYQLGLTSVRFLGKYPPSDLPPIYSDADLLVLPSTGVESFGVVLIEALACETAVLASNLPGVRTVVDASEQGDGMLMPPRDEAALTHALITLLGDRERTREMGKRGRTRVRARYDWQVIGERLERIYLDLLEQTA
jgi:glycosyltransferase involved in cell wall biosynthesis